MSQNITYADEAARRLEAIYLTPDVVAQRLMVLRSLGLRSGECVLDVGSGPGLLAHDMAATVGPAGRLCGIDISETMLAMAERRCVDQSWTEFRMGDATALPYADGYFDAAVSTQVYEYVVDLDRALAELFRVLRPGGRAVIVDTDWSTIVWQSGGKALTDRMLAAWAEHAVHQDLPRTLRPMLRKAGLVVQHHDVYTVLNPDYNANTYSYGLARLIAHYAPGRQGVSEIDARAWLEDLERVGAAGAYFFGLNRYFFTVGKA